MLSDSMHTKILGSTCGDSHSHLIDEEIGEVSNFLKAIVQLRKLNPESLASGSRLLRITVFHLLFKLRLYGTGGGKNDE